MHTLQLMKIKNGNERETPKQRIIIENQLPTKIRGICGVYMFLILAFYSIISTTEATKSLILEFVTSRLDNKNSLLCGVPQVQLNRLRKIQNLQQMS